MGALASNVPEILPFWAKKLESPSFHLSFPKEPPPGHYREEFGGIRAENVPNP